MIKWNKFINLNKARQLSKSFCDDFNLTYCEIYYVDRLGYRIYGEYCSLFPHHILILNTKENNNPIGIVIHELIHHLQYQEYLKEGEKYTDHGYKWSLAKKRVIKWCNENISNRPNWNKHLSAYNSQKDMQEFKL